MNTIAHGWDALRTKQLSKQTSIETRLSKDDYTEAVFIVNNYLRDDTSLQSLMGGNFNIFPMVAEEPSPGGKSYPYIRYVIVPGVGPFWQVRTDIVRYIVGDVSFKKCGQIMQKLIELLNIEESETAMRSMVTSKYKVQSLLFLGGSNPTGPDEDNGVIERGSSFQIMYTVVS